MPFDGPSWAIVRRQLGVCVRRRESNGKCEIPFPHFFHSFTRRLLRILRSTCFNILMRTQWSMSHIGKY